MGFLAATAVFPAAATLYFFIFWTWFGWWRRHRAVTYVMAFGVIGAVIAAIAIAHGWLFAWGLDPPVAAQVVGWLLIAAAWVLGWIADRQIGFRVRSFTPFFEEQGRIRLVTTGAYGIVRHPIYASGIIWQLGVLLVTGRLAVAVAMVIFGGGAMWFTRQEERMLLTLLEDPAEYQRYRARVPGLFPFSKR